MNILSATDESFSRRNMVTHSKIDFISSKLLLKIEHIVYPSESHSNTYPKTIQVSNLIRASLDKGINDKVNVEPYTPRPSSKVIELLIMFRLVQKDILVVDSKELISSVKSDFKDYYFYPGQRLFWDKYRLDVVSGEGPPIFDIKINSSSVNLILSRPGSVLDSSFFKSDFSFQKYGIGGLDETLIDVFKRTLSSRGLPSEMMNKMGLKHAKGIILYGPPGTGKTLIARNIGKLLSSIPPKIVNGPELLDKFVGETERKMRDLFNEAREDYRRLKQHAPLHIIIFDEIDALCKRRSSGSDAGSSVTSSLVNQLLSIMDGIEEFDNIFIIGMTNRLDIIDPGLLRPGRFEIQVRIGLPNFEGRKQIFQVHLNTMESNKILSKINYDILAKNSENFSGAEIAGAIKAGCSYPMYSYLAGQIKEIIVSESDLLRGIASITPSFGATTQILKHKLVFYSDKYRSVYDNLISHKHSIQVLIGKPGTGKTALCYDLINRSCYVYKKLVTGFNWGQLDEHSRIDRLYEIANELNTSKGGLLVLDDLESLLNYSVMGFYSRLFKSLVSVINRLVDYKWVVVLSLSSSKLLKLLEKDVCFTNIEPLDLISPEEANVIRDQLGLVSIKMTTDKPIKLVVN